MPLDNLIQRGDLLQRLNRGLEIKGRSPALTLDSMVAPIVLLEDLTQQSEFTQPKSRTASIGVSLNAVAAEFGGLAIANGIDSGMIIVVTRVVVSLGTANAVALAELPVQTVSGTYAAIATGLWLDKRNDGFPGAQMFQGTDAGGISTAPGPLELQRIGSSGPWVLWDDDGIVLRPGRALVCECLAVNQALNVSFRWREVSEP